MCVFVLQVKVAILKYIETLTLQMDAPDFVNSSETRLAVSRIITWTTEPKSSDVRKVLTHKPNIVLRLVYCISQKPQNKLIPQLILMLLERITALFDSLIHKRKCGDSKFL